MFDKLFEQTKNTVKPFNELLSLNAKAMEQLVNTQSTLFSEVMNEGVKYTNNLVSQKDIAGVYQSQKKYLDCVQEKMISSSKDVYNTMAETQEKVGEVMKGVISYSKATKK